MSWQTFTSIKKCPFCGIEYEVKDVRKADLCGACSIARYDIDVVRAGRSYSQLTDEDKKRVAERRAQGATLARGGFNWKTSGQ